MKKLIIAAVVLWPLAASAAIPELTATVMERAQRLGAKMTPERAQRIATAAEAAGERHQMKPAMVLAVIEVESAYGTMQKSVVNCRGLMQMNPRTAPTVAQQLGMRHYHLHNVEHNIALGSAYLAGLYDTFGTWSAALTAYNEGPGKFKQRRRISAYAKKVLAHLKKIEKTLIRVGSMLSIVHDEQSSWRTNAQESP